MSSNPKVYIKRVSLSIIDVEIRSVDDICKYRILKRLRRQVLAYRSIDLIATRRIDRYMIGLHDEHTFNSAIKLVYKFIHDEEFIFNDVEFAEAVSQYKERGGWRTANKLFIMEVSRATSSFLMVDAPLSVSLSLAHYEYYDLVDPVQQILYKCKCNKRQVNLSNELIEAIRHLPDEWELVIVIASPSYISDNLRAYITGKNLRTLSYDRPKDIAEKLTRVSVATLKSDYIGL